MGTSNLVRETSPVPKVTFYLNGQQVFVTTNSVGGDLSNNFELMITQKDAYCQAYLLVHILDIFMEHWLIFLFLIQLE